jgi:hypothetical protein
VKRAALLLALANVSLAHEPQPGRETLRVESVVPGGAAAAAGLRPEDVFVRFDGKEIAGFDDVRGVLAAHAPGDEVPLVVEREGKPLDLTVKLGALPDGGASLGVRIAVTALVEPGAEPTAGVRACQAWIDETYRIEAMTRDLGLDLAAGLATARACVDHDIPLIPPDKAITWCDNIFKMHCAGSDLVGDIADALVARCKGRLEQSLGAGVAASAAWTTCAQHEVYDSYVQQGVAADAAACDAAWKRCSAGERP